MILVMKDMGKTLLGQDHWGALRVWSLGMAEGRTDNDLTLKNHLWGR